MTKEERFSTITITKKTKNADSSPTYAPLRGGGLLGKKDKQNKPPSTTLSAEKRCRFRCTMLD
jgi:hypothetical protein